MSLSDIHFRAPAEPGDSPVHLRYEQARMLYASLPLSLIAITVNAAILAIVQWAVLEPRAVFAWLAGIVLVIVVRILLHYRFRRQNLALDLPSRWLGYFDLGVLLSGLAWGSTALLMFPAGEPVHQMFLLFVLAGMSAGAVTTLSAKLSSLNLFLWLTLTPLFIRLLFEQGPLTHLMAGMTLLFMVMVTLSARRANQTVVHSLKMRFAHERALAQLEDSTEHNRLLLESAAEGIFGVDMQGVTTFVNPAAAQMLGYQADELIGRSMHPVIHHTRVDGSH